MNRPTYETQNDIDDLEAQMRDTLRNEPPHRDSSAVLADMRISPQEIGRLSAEAVLAQFEQAAQSVEAMGTEVKERARKLEAALQECSNDLKLIAEAAKKIRDKGKAIYAQIEEASALSRKIHDACAEFNGKVDAT